MAAERRSFWYRLFDLPRNNESYLPYALSLKFLWAPVTYTLFSFIDGIRSIFVDEEHNDDDLDNIDSSYDIGNAPSLYRHNELTSRVSSSNDRQLSHQMVRAFELNPYSNDDLGNTPLTGFLAERVFIREQDYRRAGHREIMSVLIKLCQLAQTSESARNLLTTPNNPRGVITVELSAMGMPINSPLMLLVKAGDVEAVKELLPFYSAEELMKPTPRGNSVFHIAAITGQEELLNELKSRAVELGIWNEFTEFKNNAGYTAFDMLTALSTSKEYFRNLLDFSDVYLGGEEINKVAVTDQGTILVHMVRKGALDFYRSITNDNNSVEQEHDISAPFNRP
ncbi:ankyrin repeat domain-containing protein [Legionella quateirensis]|uniref:Ankyrin repeats (3 copies) n=1 Tax=Legionella quateirensis TaxID=45072 RepID=A0A378KUS4_9GAMM|nr:ankyrin repeat domain-containing protein [Legionella quateirensis]KTD48358.1 Ankyrin repeats (3 copies) [Legionella quateirensis]STY18312.1 Uncharacterised protein [Legionella quateirensis]